jgi:polyisoprenoid-binding protein YceI
MAIAARSFAGTYELDRVHSTVQFAVRHVGVSTFRATFADLEARLVVDDAGISLEGSVRVESISIGAPQEFRDHVVRGDDFFAVDAYPQIAFRSTSVELTDDGGATVAGYLELRGVSHRVTAQGTFQPPLEDPFGTRRVGLELETTIDRRSFGMDWQMPLPDGGDALGWEVEITAHLELTQAG